MCGCSRNALTTWTAHSAGSSGLPKNTSAIPSPVGRLINPFPVAAAANSGSTSNDILQLPQHGALFIDGIARIAHDVHEQDMGHFHTGLHARPHCKELSAPWPGR